MTGQVEQLELFDDAAAPVAAENGHPDLRAQVRAAVAEAGLSDAEVEALVEDALEQLGWHAQEAALLAPTRPAPCQCERPLVLTNPWLGRSCIWCGRRP